MPASAMLKRVVVKEDRYMPEGFVGESMSEEFESGKSSAD
jgi:hypothetical protein